MHSLAQARENVTSLGGALCFVLVLGFAMAVATAADKPFYAGKTIRMIVPFSPGGGTDT